MTTTEPETKCLYCSLGCDVVLETHPHGVVQPGYVPHQIGTQNGRLCYRGHYIAALASHPRRLTGPEFGTQRAPSSSGQDAMDQAAAQIDQAAGEQSLGVLLPANLPTTELLAAGRFFQQRLPVTCISFFTPPTDVAILDAVHRVNCALGGLEEVPECDAILAVGDVLGTHPVLAHTIMDIIENHPKTALANLDTMAGRTLRFATTPLQAKPDSGLYAVLALASEAGVDLKTLIPNIPSRDVLFETSGLSPAPVQQCLESLRSAKNPLIMISLPQGRDSQANHIAHAVCHLAQALNMKLLPLFACGGSPGAYSVSRTLGLPTLAEWLTQARQGSFTSILGIDVNPAGLMPCDLLSEIFGESVSLIAVSAMPNSTTERADIILPLALDFEMNGDLLDHLDRVNRLSALRRPSGSAGSLIDLLNRLAETIRWNPITPADQNLALLDQKKLKLQKTKLPQPVFEKRNDTNSFKVIARTETIDLYDGEISRQLDWPLSIEPIPVAWIHPHDAERLGVANKDAVSLSHPAGTEEFSIRINTAVPIGAVAISPSIPQSRNFFSWQIHEQIIEIKPISVEMNILSQARKE